MTLNNIINFAERENIDFDTELDAIVKAYESIKALRKPNSLKVFDPKETKLADADVHFFKEKINPTAVKNEFEMEIEKMQRYFDFCCTTKVVVGSTVAQCLEKAKHFHPENVMMLKNDVVYVGYFDYDDKENLENRENIESHHIMVFVDNSYMFPKNTAEFHCYESYASKELKELMPLVKIERSVCR